MSRRPSGVAVTGIGAVSPVGLSATATAAALRAGIARLGPVASSEVEADAGETAPAIGGRVPLEWLRGGPEIEEWPGHERAGREPPPPAHLFVEDGPARLAALAVPAAREARTRAGAADGALEGWGLYLGLPEEEDPAPVVAALIEGLAPFRPRVVEVVRRGRAAALAALHQGAAEVAAGRLAGALVGGVDSLIRPTVYDRLAEAGALKGEDNPQGIHPGEAAAFLALEARPRAERVLARVLGTGTGEEPTAGTDRPNQGVGLTAAVRAARAAAAPLAHRPLVICDLNGDRYRALEWGLVMIRTLGDLTSRAGGPDNSDFWHPADCTGDAGAASGAIDCVFAVEALRKGYGRTDRVLVWGASDGSLRAAALVAGSAD